MKLLRALSVLVFLFISGNAEAITCLGGNSACPATFSGTISGTYTLGGTPTFSAPSFTSQILSEGGRLLIGGHDTTEVPNASVGSESTCLGDKACSHATGSNITAIGHNSVGDSGSNPFTGVNITCIGTDCMRNPLNSAGSDVGVGTAVLKFWQSNFSVALGVTAMQGAADGTATGDSNVAIGNAALSNTAGSSAITATRNIAIGDTAGPAATTANDNVWIGHHVATLATTAQKNVWLGRDAGAGATGMFESVLIGWSSGKVLTGNSNTFLGDETGLVATTANNNTVIGHQVGKATLASGSNILLLGTSSATDSNTSNSIHIGAGGADVISATGTGTPATSITTTAGPTILSGAGFTVSTLPASPGTGARSFVTDATACGTLGGALTGGGSTKCPTFYNGASWVQG